jgi:hypothetical protein
MQTNQGDTHLSHVVPTIYYLALVCCCLQGSSVLRRDISVRRLVRIRPNRRRLSPNAHIAKPYFFLGANL